MPTVVALRRTHPENELVSIAITAGDEEDLYLKHARELGVTYAIGSANWYGEDSTYLHLGETAGPTHAFVIGRRGPVRSARRAG